MMAGPTAQEPPQPKWEVIADVTGRYLEITTPEKEAPKKLKDKARDAISGGGEQTKLENLSGVVIGLQRTSRYEEISAVAFQRREGVAVRHEQGFKEVLDEEMEKAQQAADFLNALFANAGKMQ